MPLNQVDQFIVNFLPTIFIVISYLTKLVHLKFTSHHCLYLNHFKFIVYFIKNNFDLVFFHNSIQNCNSSFYHHLFHFHHKELP